MSCCVCGVLVFCLGWLVWLLACCLGYVTCLLGLTFIVALLIVLDIVILVYIARLYLWGALVDVGLSCLMLCLISFGVLRDWVLGLC